MTDHFGSFGLFLLLLFFLPAAACDNDDDDDDNDASPGDDDDDNDDASPSDDDDNDTLGPPQMHTPELVDGRAPGLFGTAVGFLPDGRAAVAATRGRALYYYVVDEAKAELTSEPVTEYAEAPDLAIDANGAAHLVYLNSATWTIDYATNASGAWVRESIEAVVPTYLYPLILLDADGQPHVAYVRHITDPRQDEVVYAVKSGAAWEIEVVDEAEHGFESRAQFILDAEGNAYLGYKKDISYRIFVADNAGGAWNIEEIRQTETEGGQFALALDGAGVRHLAYSQNDYYYGSSELIYGNDAGGAWTFETIDSDDNYPLGACLQLRADASGTLHLAHIHYAWSDIDLRLFPTQRVYGKRVAGVWQLEEFASNDRSPVQLSLALNAAGQAMISAHDSVAFDLYLFDNTTGDWRTRMIEAGADRGQRNSLAVDHEGKPAVSHYQWGDPALLLTSFNGESWQTDTISDSEVSANSKVVFDSQNVPHVFYIAGSPEKLLHARKNGNAWQTETVVASNLLSSTVSVVIAVDDSLHLLYADLSRDTFNYATNASGQWTITVVEPDAYLFDDHDLALDSQGRVHAALSSNSNHNEPLYYATNASGEWTKRRIESPGECVGRMEIEIDSADRVHIAYYSRYDYEPQDVSWEYGMRYASNVTGEWQTELVKVHAGMAIALALDRRGRPVIVFSEGGRNNMDCGDLSAAWKQDGAWQTAILDQPGEVGDYLSLVRDADDLFHVSYYGARSLYYATFTMNE